MHIKTNTFLEKPTQTYQLLMKILAIKIVNPFSPSGVKVKHKIHTYALLVTVFDDAVDMPFISVI